MDKPGLRGDQYEVLISSIRGLERGMDRIEGDLSRDRQDMQDFKVRLATVEQEIKALRAAMNDNVERVKDKVAGVVVPATEEVTGAVDKFRKSVENKKFLLFRKPGLFTRLFRRGVDKQ